MADRDEFNAQFSDDYFRLKEQTGIADIREFAWMVWNAARTPPAEQVADSGEALPDERDAFEQHIKNIFPHSWKLDLASDRMTGYGSLQIRLMWQAWQARAALAAQPAAEPLATLILGGIEGDELSENDIQCNNKAIEALQERLVRTEDSVYVELYAQAQPAAGQVAGGVDLLRWAVERWHAEVADRPLENRHRRSLDDAWRQMIRKLGADDVFHCGPRHDALLAATGSGK